MKLKPKKTVKPPKKSKTHVRENEYVYRDIFDSTTDAIFVHDAVSGRIVDVNKAVLRMFGWRSKKEILANKVVGFGANKPPHTNAEAIRRLRLAASGKPQVFEWHARKRNGTTFWVEVSLRFLRVGGEKRIVAVVHDISERKRNEMTLRENESKYRALVDSSPDAIAIYVKGKIVFANDMSLRLMRADHVDQLIGKPVIEFVHPDDRPFVTKRMMEAMQSGRSLPSAEERFIRVDGTVVDVEVKSMSVVFDGKPGVQIVVRDITERKKMEEALRKSEEQYRRFFEDDLSGVYLSTPGGRILACNPALVKIMGYDSTGELLQVNAFNLYPTRGKREEFLRKLRQQRRLVNEDSELVRKDGRPVQIVETVIGVFDERNELVEFRGYVFDVSERRRAEEWQANILRTIPIILYAAETPSAFDATWLSENVTRVTGFSSESFVQQEEFWSSRVHPDDKERVDRAFASIHKGQEMEVEYRWLCSNGTYRCFLDRATFIRQTSDGRVEYSGIWLDITERKQAEEALRESEGQYRTLVEAARIGIGVADLEGNILLCNEAMLEQSGYTRDDLDRGFNVMALYSDLAQRQHALSLLQQHGVVHQIPVQFKRKDGSSFDTLLSLTRIQFRGKPCVQALVEDITERKLAEDKIRLHSEELAALLKVSHELASTLNLATVLQTTVNRITELTELKSVAVYLLEGEMLRLWATVPPLPPQFPEELRIAPLSDHPHIRKTIMTGESVFIRDTATADLTPAERSVMELRGLRSILYLPIMAGAKVMGTLIIAHIGEPRVFTESEVNLCSTLSNVAAVVLQNAFLYESSQRSVADLEQQILETKKAEEALRESEARLRAIIDAEPECVKILSLEGAVVEMNQAGIAMLEAKSLEEVQQQDLIDYVVPPHRKSYMKYFLDTLRGPSGRTLEFEVVGLKGTHRWLETNAVPLLDGHQQVTAVLAITRNITERKLAEQASKQAEEALRKSETQYRYLIETMPDGVYRSTHEGKFLEVNPAMVKILGYDSKEDLLAIDIKSQLYFAKEERVSAALEEKNEEMAVFRLRKKDGSEVWVEDHGRHVVDEEGNILYHEGILRDITERKRMEEDRLKIEQQIQQTQKLESLGLLAGGIAHDFNNLLGGIFGYVELAKKSADNGDTTKTTERLSKAMNVFSRAKDLTKQLLTFSKGGAPAKTPGDIAKTLSETVQFALSGSNVKGEYSIAGNLWSCSYDPNQIAQVIDNIVINAKHAMPNGGVLEVSASNALIDSGSGIALPNGPYIKIALEDHGIGIPEQYLQKIFDPFFTTKQAGSGLGLTTCWSIVKRHDGIMRVESQSGKGSTFFIYLPAIPDAVSVGDTVSAENFMGHGKILVMDDEEHLREILEDMLKDIGYTVQTASHGAEAIELYLDARAEGNPFDLVLVDLTIPGGMGGKETLDKLIELDKTVRVIASSGYSEDPVMSAPRDYGFAASIRKPYRKAELVEAIIKALAERKV